MKKILSLMLAFLLVFGMAACSEETPGPIPDAAGSIGVPSTENETGSSGTEINIGVLKGPTGMGAARLMDQNEQGLTLNSYNFTVAGSADELTGQLIQGGLDIAALPTNAIASLYNKTEGEIVCIGVNTLGVLYILENGESISDFSDLDGKTILASGKGSTAEFVITHLIEESGISADISWASEHTEAATMALTGEYDIVMLPEPFVTSVISKSEEFRVALDLTQEWNSITGKDLTMGGLAVRKEFLDEHFDAVKEFFSDYRMSIDYTNDDPAGASLLIEKYGIADAAVAESAIPRCNIVFFTGEGYRTVLMNFFEVLFEANPAFVGGALPDEEFYY